jgi:hypothetical protein
VVGAVLQATALDAAAQVPQRDTTRRTDSLRVRGDTLVVPIPPQADTALREPRVTGPDTLRDTLQAPIARAELPATLEIGEVRRWDREALFASGALSLAELLARLPGVTTFTTGWVATPSVASYYGDPGLVRVFLDGIALDVLDPRDGGVQDLSDIQLWMLEELLVERGATELRVHARSWRVQRIVPETRTDVGTGDQKTNVFRGFYGKRWRNGAALQVAAQQWGSDAEYRYGAEGDELSIFARTGWARGRWSADGALLTARRSRSDQENYLALPSLPDMDRTRSLAYLRVGYGDPAAGPWAQLIASTRRVSGEIGATDGAAGASSLERTAAQYVATGGASGWGLRLSGAARLRAGEGERTVSGHARLGWERSFAGLVALVERDRADSIDRAELSARLSPLSWLTLSATAGRAREEWSAVLHLPDPSSELLAGGEEEVDYARAELGLRLGETWLSGGVLARTASRLDAATIFDADYVRVLDDEARGAFAAARGRLWRDVHVDAMITAWDSAGYYRPRFTTRTTLALVTRWLRKFPSGDFALRFAVTHDYRSDVRFPAPGGDRTAPGALEGQLVNNTISTQLEIRIADAVVYWQLRNLAGQYTEEVPGFLRPRQTNLYGVRWAFTN